MPQENFPELAVDQFDPLRTSALARLRQASVELDYLLGYKPDRYIDVEDNGLFRLSATKNELATDTQVQPLFYARRTALPAEYKAIGGSCSIVGRLKSGCDTRSIL